MKILGRSFVEYVVVSRNFWTALFIIMILQVVVRLSSSFPAGIQALLSISGVVVLVWAGWTSVKRHGFDLKQVSIVALWLSLAVHWSLPVFHRPGEVVSLILINSFIYAVLAALGGVLARISARYHFGRKKWIKG